MPQTSSDRDRAVDRSLTRRGGQPRLICEECGSALLRRSGAPVCGKDAAHGGFVEAPSHADQVVLGRLRHAHADKILDSLTEARRRRLGFLILRLHNWGSHQHCRWLAAVGVSIVCDAAAPRPRPIDNLWGKESEDA